MNKLWPKPLPVIGLTGDHESGKTSFAMSICPGPQTLYYDIEMSGASSAEDFGVTRVDVCREMHKRYPKGHQPIQLWEWWLDDLRSRKSGEFRVIAIDPISELESGLADWVTKHPERFGHTDKQYQKMTGIFWGDVKSLWKQVLTEAASRCETLVFIAHTVAIFANNQATGRKKPKGKGTLEELASLYLWLERKKIDGVPPKAPTATLVKNRLIHVKIEEDGSFTSAPILPPRLPVATPAAIRAYMLKPADYGSLSDSEKAPEERLSEEEMLELRVRVAEAELEAERIRHQGGNHREMSSERVSEAKEESRQQSPAVAQEQLEEIKVLRDQLFAVKPPSDPKEAWRKILEVRGVATAKDLTSDQANELIEKLKAKIASLQPTSKEGQENQQTTEAEPVTKDPPATPEEVVSQIRKNREILLEIAGKNFESEWNDLLYRVNATSVKEMTPTQRVAFRDALERRCFLLSVAGNEESIAESFEKLCFPQSKTAEEANGKSHF